MGVIRYFKIKTDLINNLTSALLMPDDGDSLPLDALINAVPVYQDDSIGMSIVKCLLSDDQLADMATFAGTDPLTWAGVEALGIAESYMGEDVEQCAVLWKLRTGLDLNLENFVDVNFG